MGTDPDSPFHPETAERRAEARLRVSTAAERVSERRALEHAVGSNDQELIQRIEQLGITGESVKALDLLPLVHVAWADGRVQAGERAAVLSLLERRGLGPESEPYVLFEALLEQRPSETFLAESLALVKDLAARSGKDPADLVDLCARIAESGGGLFGWGERTSDEEVALIRRIAEALGGAAIERFETRFRK